MIHRLTLRTVSSANNQYMVCKAHGTILLTISGLTSSAKSTIKRWKRSARTRFRERLKKKKKGEVACPSINGTPKTNTRSCPRSKKKWCHRTQSTLMRVLSPLKLGCNRSKPRKSKRNSERWLTQFRISPLAAKKKRSYWRIWSSKTGMQRKKNCTNKR